jgi:hypothetical protein
MAMRSSSKVPVLAAVAVVVGVLDWVAALVAVTSHITLG